MLQEKIFKHSKIIFIALTYNYLLKASVYIFESFLNQQKDPNCVNIKSILFLGGL